MTTWAYLRVSSPKRKNGRSKQKTDSQKTALKHYCQSHKLTPTWVEDFMSGRKDERPGWQSILENIREGDTLLCWKMDRLGRSAVSCIRALETLLSRKVRIVIVSTGMTFNGSDGMSLFLVQLFSALSQLESSLISDRVRASIEHRREKGIRVGRKPSEARSQIQRLIDKRTPVSVIAKKLGKTRQSVYQMISRMQESAA